MFKSLESTTTAINEHVFLKFIEADAPFFSKLELYHHDNMVSDCSFKPREKRQIKENLNNFDDLMNALGKLNKQTKSIHLGNFIELIESYSK